MQSISSSNCVLVPWCSSTPFYPKRARYSVRLSDSSKGDDLKNRQFFHRWDQKRGFNLSTLRNTFQHSLLLKFDHALNFFIKFLLLPWCTSTPLYSKRARYSVHLKNSSMEDIMKRGNFFTDENKKVVLTSLRLETRSDKYYYWIFTMHSMSSSNLFLRPWCTSTPFFSKSKIFVHLSDSSMGDFLKRSTYSIEETKKVVLICVCLETGSNTLHFWNFTLHSISSSNCVLRPWCCSTPFCSEWARYSVHLSDSSKRDRLKRSNFFEDETKKSFNLSTLRKTFQHSLLLKFDHALNFFIKFLLLPWCTSTPIFSKSKIFVHLSDSSMGDFLKRSTYSIEETKKVVLICVCLETGSNTLHFWNFTLHSISSSNCVLRPWCCSTPFCSEWARYSVHLSDSSKRDLLKRSNFIEDETKKSFNLSTLRNRFQHLLLLEYHHPLNFFIKFLLLPWCNCTLFYSKKARSSVHLKNSSTEDILKWSIFFTDETKKVVLTCLRLETRSDKHYYWNFIMHSISSSNFFLRPWCTSTPFFYKRASICSSQWFIHGG